MKKLFLIAMVACAAVILSSCSKDDNNDPSTNTVKKRITQMKYVHTDSNGKERGGYQMDYTYGSDGKPLKVKNTETWDGSSSITYSTFAHLSSSQIKETYTDSDGRVISDSDIKLDNNGRIISSEDGVYAQSYTYNADGYIQSGKEEQSKFSDSEINVQYSWENGNMVKCVVQHNETHMYQYSNIPSPSNFDCAMLPNFAGSALLYDYTYPVLGILGKGNKNLISHSEAIRSYDNNLSQTDYTYELDSDGYPIKVIVKLSGSNGSSPRTTTYWITYEIIK